LLKTLENVLVKILYTHPYVLLPNVCCKIRRRNKYVKTRVSI